MRIAEYKNGEVTYRDATEEEIEEQAKIEAEMFDEPTDPVANAYSVKTIYKTGELVQYNGEMYRFKLNRAKGILPTNKTYWEKVNMTTIINELKEEK